ncbi:MAG: hypothetical protein OEZ06_27190 [Myxococcales bacterium]|nr:hypothetical protein [Myxococcales bacterium]
MAQITPASRALAACLALVVIAAAGLARAQSEPKAPRYQVGIHSAFHYAARDDFEYPVYLFQQRLQRLVASELRAKLQLGVSITPRLSFEVGLPLAYRHALVTLDWVVISPEQALGPLEHSLSGFGLADPSLAFGYRVAEFGAWSFSGRFGSVIGLDDNPASNTFPRRMPLSTGQSQVFASGRLALALGAVEAALDYRFAYFVGSAATYLVRRVGNQSYASGGFGDFLGHRLELQTRIGLTKSLSLLLLPRAEVSEVPRLMQQSERIEVFDFRFLYELYAAAGIELELASEHHLQLRASLPLFQAFQSDPFFPLRMPERGLSLIWEVRRR